MFEQGKKFDFPELIWVSGFLHFSFQEIIDDDDQKLKGLKRSYGKAAYTAVVAALTELNESQRQICNLRVMEL